MHTLLAVTLYRLCTCLPCCNCWMPLHSRPSRGLTFGTRTCPSALVSSVHAIGGLLRRGTITPAWSPVDAASQRSVHACHVALWDGRSQPAGCAGLLTATPGLSACVSGVNSMILGTNATWSFSVSHTLSSAVCARPAAAQFCMVPVLCNTACGRWTSLVFPNSSRIALTCRPV